MNQATDVNVVPSYGQRGELHFSQYDVGRVATINLYGVNEAFTIPVSSTVKIQATKPSGLGFDVACSYSGSVVTVTSTATMTAEAGRFPCEIKITKNSDIIGTANIMFCVEPSPHPDDIVDGDAGQVVNQIKALVLQAEGYSQGTQNGTPVTSESVYYENNAKWYSENAVLSAEVKQNLLQCFRNVAWIGNNGQTYYDALANALNRGNVLVSISAVYTQGGTVYDTDTLDSLKSDLIVTATYNDSSTETVLAYTLSGTLTVGTSTITVSYGGKTTTFSVTVTKATYPANLNILFSDITLSDGYIDDNGDAVADTTSKYYDKKIPAVGMWLLKSDGTIWSYSNLYYRLAEYDSSGTFMSRSAIAVSSASNTPALASNSPNSIIMGFNKQSTVLANADRFVGCNVLDSTICTLPNKSVDSNGNIIYDANNQVSDYLPVNSGYIIAKNTNNYDSSLVVFYDSSKNLISRNGVTSGTITQSVQNLLVIAVPNNAEYVVFRSQMSPNSTQYISYAI